MLPVPRVVLVMAIWWWIARGMTATITTTEAASPSHHHHKKDARLRHFGSKTTYDAFARHHFHSLSQCERGHHFGLHDFGDDDPHEGQQEGERARETCARDARNCTVERLFMVTRHGTRMPTRKYLRKFDEVMSRLFPNWTNPFHPADEGLLTPVGERELFQLGRRTRDRFPELFLERAGQESHHETKHNHNSERSATTPRTYHPRHYLLQSSQSLRALQSAAMFAQGLFGVGGSYPIVSNAALSDRMMRFHESCPRYRKMKKEVLKRAFEREKEEVLREIAKEVREDFARRGERQQIAFDESHVVTLWTACRFEYAVFGKLDGACLHLTPRAAERLELLDDVADYWEKGPGNEINWKMSCELVREAMEFLSIDSSLAKGELDARASLKAAFFFGHAETVMPFVSALGLFSDPVLANSPFASDSSRGRKWRSGVVAPFGANVALVLKRCEGGDSPETKRQVLTVELVHNERSVSLAPLCGSHECELPIFLERLEARFLPPGPIVTEWSVWVGTCFDSVCGE